MGLEFEKHYTSHLTYEQWKTGRPLIPPTKPGGHLWSRAVWRH